MDGKQTGGAAMRMPLLLSAALLVGLTTGAAARAADDLEGAWAGTLKPGAGVEIRLVLKVKTADDGRPTATLDSPDEGLSDLPLDVIDLKGETLTFERKAIRAKFTGRRNEAETAFVGAWVQNGQSFSLTLEKTDPAALARPEVP